MRGPRLSDIPIPAATRQEHREGSHRDSVNGHLRRNKQNYPKGTELAHYTAQLKQHSHQTHTCACACDCVFILLYRTSHRNYHHRGQTGSWFSLPQMSTDNAPIQQEGISIRNTQVNHRKAVLRGESGSETTGRQWQFHDKPHRLHCTLENVSRAGVAHTVQSVLIPSLDSSPVGPCNWLVSKVLC